VRRSVSTIVRNQLGRVLAMVPSKGGAGATFLATNLAFGLSMQGKRVAVIDLNLYFGDAVIFLSDSMIKSSVVDLARKSQQMDRTLLESSMIKVSDRLHVLAAPESPVNVGDVAPADIERIIELARSCYDFVVLDISSTLDTLTVKALDLSDFIYLIVQLNLPFVRAAKRMVEAFHELGYPSDKIRVVVNRYQKGGDISLADVEKATLLKVDRKLSNSHAAASASINQGVPLLELMPRDPVANALSDWSKEWVPGLKASKSEGGWFSGFQRHSS
jgi:pilus assembly protein CpaE